MRRIGVAAALAAMMSGVGSGVSALQEMFAPRFNFDGPTPHDGRRGKRRGRAHNASPEKGRRHSYTFFPKDKRCGEKQRRSYLRQDPWANINHHFDKRMAWNETTGKFVRAHQQLQRIRSMR